MHPSPAAQSIAAAHPYDTIRRSSHERHRPADPDAAALKETAPVPSPEGGEQGEGRPTVRPALPRITHVWVRSSKKPSIGPPDGQGIFGIHIVAVYFTYATATTAAPCPTDALLLRFSNHRRCRRMPNPNDFCTTARKSSRLALKNLRGPRLPTVNPAVRERRGRSTRAPSCNRTRG